MSIVTPPWTLTADAFEAVEALPENSQRRLELINGEVVEVVSNSYASETAAVILTLLGAFVRAHALGRVFGADAGFHVGGDRYQPDVAYISRARQPEAFRGTWNPLAPDLAVEVVSPSDRPRDIRLKIMTYVAAGTTVWLVQPDDQTVEVYTPAQSGRVLNASDTLDGGSVLPGFTVAVRDLFAPETFETPAESQPT